LNLPKIDGRQVLQRLRANKSLRRLAVVIFTTSQHEEDIIRTDDLGANAYTTKPMELRQFMQVVRQPGDVSAAELDHGMTVNHQAGHAWISAASSS
jgi:DNA-binding response OmpR family regulator